MLATGCGQQARGGGVGGEGRGRVGRLNLVDWALGLLVLGSAVAVKPLALIRDLAQMDILTIRVLT